MPRNSFIQMTKLHNVRGRIYYISSPKKQENLYAVYETTERSFWSDLAKCNHAEFKKSGTEGKCIEARELIIALPESFTEYPPDKLLQIFTDHFRQTYGTDCIAALHHNKRKTNYHIHLIFSERTLLEQPIEKVATRNMFYDEKGNHVRTKKEILDEDGNIRKRCKVIHKGEVYERQIFSIKDKRFKAENFLDTVKQDYTNLINQYVQNEKQRLQVFERGGMYLATKKIGKNNPKAAEMEADNAKRTLWNQTVDRAIVTGVAKSEIMQIKKERITDRIAESVWIYGNRPNLLSSIIGTAIAVLELLISKVLLKTLELADKVISKELEAEPEAVSYKHLCEIYQKLQEQNKAIFALEKQRSDLEIELSDSKGIFKAKRRSELSTEIAGLEERISRMKVRLSQIVKEYGYPNAEAFYKAFHKAETAYGDYQDSLKNWEQQYGEKPQSLHDKLKSKKQDIKERELTRPYSPPNRGRSR
ncbi:MobA/MobL family protein [Coprococcus eutactus]|uniref:MobA/MobL family protein n=1 Tax=Coprococcus eutactus TaxID=33043 RepID=UPI0006C45350|nr:MobA/MobL family protein [Coprococcus eutactus]CUN57835.1 Ti-type conjugative transfer relaxase TraA [Coprococcus eutactus]